MVKLYIADCDRLKDGALFDAYYARADEARRRKVDALSDGAARLSLGAYSLLAAAMAKNGFAMGEWTLSKDGKPRFSDGALPFFSISHSGKYALCALSDGEAGCDIQLMRPFDGRILKRVLTCSELAAMRALEGREATEYFYRAWTVKESYVKLTGEGLGRRLSDIGTDGDGRILLCGEDTGVSAVNICLGDYAAACAFTGEPPAGIEREIL